MTALLRYTFAGFFMQAHEIGMRLLYAGYYVMFMLQAFIAPTLPLPIALLIRCRESHLSMYLEDFYKNRAMCVSSGALCKVNWSPIVLLKL
jgi:hypothetical protein